MLDLAEIEFDSNAYDGKSWVQGCIINFIVTKQRVNMGLLAIAGRFQSKYNMMGIHGLLIFLRLVLFGMVLNFLERTFIHLAVIIKVKHG